MPAKQPANFSGLASICIVAAFAVALTACESTETTAAYPKNEYDRERARYGSILDAGDESGFTLWDSRDRKKQYAQMGVNSYLWRASLDTIGFMPLLSADSNGGVILTDWYSGGNANERVKLNIRIKDGTLRADGVQVTVFRQVKQKDAWVDAAAAPATGREVEDAILQRARELRQLDGKKDE
jgi:hypothetical protein